MASDSLKQDLSYPLSSNAPSPESIHLLRRKLAATRKVSKAINDEYNRNEVILTQLKGMLGEPNGASDQPNFSFMSDAISSQAFSGQQPLSTNVNFALSQLPALKALVTELRSRMNGLKQPGPVLETAKDELKQERRDYIEQRTKAYLERSGQIGSESSGPIAGKSVDPGEITALEKLAGSFNPP